MSSTNALRCCLFLLAASAVLNAQSYSLLVLEPTADLKGNSTAVTAACSMNDLRQILGWEATNEVSYLVVWTKGVPVKLEVPTGYNFANDCAGYWFITNSSQVMGPITVPGPITGESLYEIGVWSPTGPNNWGAATVL